MSSKPKYVQDQEMVPGVYWVGIVDWMVRIFHGYHTDEGSSYNSYLIDDECPTVIDSVKYPFAEEWLSRIAACCPLDKIKYVVMNHAEGDHASSLKDHYHKFTNATFVCTKKCQEHLKILYGMENATWLIVDDKYTLKIGKRTLKFIPVPLLHWPDSTFTYCPEDKILFSNDGFGQHYATSKRWADECDVSHVMHLFKEYTANILGLFSAQMRKALEVASTVEIKYILSAHGVSWRGDAMGLAIAEYDRWSKGQHCQKKVTVVLDSMYGTTHRMALALLDGARSTGCETVLLEMTSSDITKVALHTYDSGAVAFASPTLNNTMMPSIAAALNYVKGLTLIKGKPAFAFGAFGWSNRAVPDIVAELRDGCKAEVYDEKGITFKFNYTEALLEQAYNAGVDLGKRAIAYCEKNAPKQ